MNSDEVAVVLAKIEQELAAAVRTRFAESRLWSGKGRCPKGYVSLRMVKRMLRDLGNEVYRVERDPDRSDRVFVCGPDFPSAIASVPDRDRVTKPE